MKHKRQSPPSCHMAFYAYRRQTVIAFIYSTVSNTVFRQCLYGFIHTGRQTCRAGSDFRLINGTIRVQQTTRASAEHCLVCRLYAASTHTRTHTQPPIWQWPWPPDAHSACIYIYAWWEHEDDFFLVFMSCILLPSRPGNKEQLRGQM